MFVAAVLFTKLNETPERTERFVHNCENYRPSEGGRTLLVSMYEGVCQERPMSMLAWLFLLAALSRWQWVCERRLRLNIHSTLWLLQLWFVRGKYTKGRTVRLMLNACDSLSLRRNSITQFNLVLQVERHLQLHPGSVDSHVGCFASFVHVSSLGKWGITV